MKRIAVDMDEVLADFSEACLREMNRKVGTNFTKQSLEGKNFKQLYSEHLDVLYDTIHDPQFFRHLRVIEGSQRVLRALSEQYEIAIATAAMEVPSSFQAKYDWLIEHFDFLDPSLFIFCGNKSVVQADYLIDDTLRQLERFEGEGILFRSPLNATVEYDVAYSTWDDVARHFGVAVGQK